MADQPANYVLGIPIHRSKWIPDMQASVEGWEYPVRDKVTGALVPVFVDDAHYDKANVKAAVEAALAVVRDVHTLGQ